MYTAFAVVTILTIVANLAVAVTDLMRLRFVMDNSREVGVPSTWILPLAVLKGAGAVGLLLGLIGVPYIGFAAAVGLVLFFVGAVAAHVRARVFHNIYFSVGYLVLAVATLGLGIAVLAGGRGRGSVHVVALTGVMEA